MKRPTAMLLYALLASAAMPAGQAAPAAEAGSRLSRQDLEVVDCALPGQVRMLGNRTYLAQRRPVQTTAADCRIQGGEFVAYDRANLQTALNVWMEAAQGGDVEAQFRVGDIYERGLGTTPDYVKAAEWYQKAIDGCAGKSTDRCNPSQALFNLATLYERGLGVEKDELKALNLYRASWGLKDDDLMYQTAVERQVADVRAQLEQSIAERDSQINALEKQVAELEAKVQKQSGQAAEVSALRSLVTQLRNERTASANRLATLPAARTREPSKSEPVPVVASTVAPRSVSGMKMGRYFALIIGNERYQSIESLATPRRDVEKVADILKSKYGFSVTAIEDADDVAMLRALNDLAAVLRPDDNLLIYYAGHGERLPAAAREVGYWLPVNADPPPKDTFWVPNEQVTAHLARLPVRRALVVADSCYAGLLSDDPSALFLRDPGAVTLDYIKYKLPRRSRLLIASGGDAPVLDQGGGGNSVFARAFLDVLSGNDTVLSAPALFYRLQVRVREAAARTGFKQVPQFKTIKSAGNELGDFFFVPGRD